MTRLAPDGVPESFISSTDGRARTVTAGDVEPLPEAALTLERHA
jgi:hypothetical protein